MKSRRMRVHVIGLDGATFTNLSPWMEMGLLPNLEKVFNNGVSGVLKTIVPAYTPAAWTSFATGVNPGKHGVFGFVDVLPNGRKSIVSSRSVRSPTLWNILSQEGYRVAVVNVPVTYPPVKVNGIIVSGMLTPTENHGYTYPSDLKDEILANFPDYKAIPYKDFPEMRKTKPAQDVLKAMRDRMRQVGEVYQYLWEKEPWDLYINVLREPDVIQHLFWDDIEAILQGNADEDINHEILKTYQAIDELIGRRIDTLDDDTVLIILSDHGFGKRIANVFLSKWLYDNGYLSLRHAEGAKANARRQLAKIRHILVRLGFRDPKVLIKRKQVVDKISRAGQPEVDWENTRAYAGTPSDLGIYINLKGRDPNGIVSQGDEYERIRSEIVQKLSLLEDPLLNQPVFEGVYRREDVYHGPYTYKAPDIVAVPRDMAYHLSSGLVFKKTIDRDVVTRLEGEHRMRGVYAIYGNGIPAQNTDAQLLDIAPTILRIMGFDVPYYMDGSAIDFGTG